MDNFCADCEALGEDYYTDDDGRVVCACDHCYLNGVGMYDGSDR